MADATGFLARGKVLRTLGDQIVFNPTGTNYELHLVGPYTGPLHVPVSLRIFARGRKLLTVPSGGNFVTPIMGPPRIFQGRVRFADDRVIGLHAGVNVLIELPADEDAVDLAMGPITVGGLLNATVYPGVRFDYVPETAGVTG